MTLNRDQREMLERELRQVAQLKAYIPSSVIEEIKVRVQRLARGPAITAARPAVNAVHKLSPLVMRPGVAPRPLDPFFFEIKKH